MPFQKSGGFRETLEDARTARRLTERKYDLAIIVPRSFRSALAPYLAGVPVRTGYGYWPGSVLLTHPQEPPEDRWATHRVRTYFHLLSPWHPAPELQPNRNPPHIYVPPGTVDEVKRTLDEKFGSDRRHRPLVAINPGAAYGTAKRWLPDRYAKLARWIHKTCSGRCVVLGSPAERELCEKIAFAAGEGVVSLAGETDVLELAAVLAESDLLLTNDTGTMHVADAVGTPIVAIFGPTHPETTSPFRVEHAVIREPVHCSPCELRHCPIDHRCMTRISVSRVFRNVVEMLPGADPDEVPLPVQERVKRKIQAGGKEKTGG